jgi:hypothetical protein
MRERERVNERGATAASRLLHTLTLSGGQLEVIACARVLSSFVEISYVHSCVCVCYVHMPQCVLCTYATVCPRY